MTTPFLADDISHDEGFRSQAYPDPLSGGEPWTCGYGCTGPDVRPGTVWTAAQAAARRDAKIADAIRTLHAGLPVFPHLNPARQDVLANMVYNMGWRRFTGFHHLLVALSRGDFEDAAVEMLDSKWARQVGARALRLARQMRRGVRL